MAKKKFETAEKRATRFQEELRVGCTTEKGIVRKLTAEEVQYREGYLEEYGEVIRTNVFSEMNAEGALKLSRQKGKESLIATLRGEKSYAKIKEEKKQLEKLQKKYPKQSKGNSSAKTNNAKPKQK